MSPLLKRINREYRKKRTLKTMLALTVAMCLVMLVVYSCVAESDRSAAEEKEKAVLLLYYTEAELRI